MPSQQPVGQVVALHDPPWQTPPTQVCPLAVSHVWQRLPLLPQLVLVVPEVHSPLEMSTHPLQAVHVPATQVCFDEQLAQVAPPLPHCAEFVRLMHEVPWQHPSGQVAGPHDPGPASGGVVGTHLPALVHSSVDLQATHEAPPDPQAVLVVPARHTNWPSTQPSHEGRVHLPSLVHSSFELQAMQAAPAAPQEFFAVPARHTPRPSMQPSQEPPMQRPLALQVAPVTQATQLKPWLPHAVVTLPAWQAPVMSMQPKQVAFWQRPAEVHCWLPLQTSQSTPPRPQLLNSAPLMHASPLQQPAQLFSLHTGV